MHFPEFSPCQNVSSCYYSVLVAEISAISSQQVRFCMLQSQFAPPCQALEFCADFQPQRNSGAFLVCRTLRIVLIHVR